MKLLHLALPCVVTLALAAVPLLYRSAASGSDRAVIERVRTQRPVYAGGHLHHHLFEPLPVAGMAASAPAAKAD